MACLNIFISNRMEVLAEQLTETLRSPLSSPLQNEIVIVQNRSMERWISMQIARRLGVCANVRFPFPRAFLYEILAKLTGAAPGDEYEPEIMTWRIMKILPESLSRPVFGSLRRYLADDPAGLKRFQLAARIARVFDGYLIFRPDLITAWERGDSGTEDELWQAELWRMMLKEGDTGHLIAHREKILQQLRAAPPPLKGILPERISIFGISTLPGFYLDLFHALSQATEVHCFFMNPCREFWGDIRSEKETGRLVQRVREQTGWNAVSKEDLYLEEGNALLASLGKQGRDFFTHLANLAAEMRETFVDSGEETLLAALQSDVLNLRDRGRKGTPRAVVSSRDRTLSIHSCHGPLREVEVLHDQLLEMFAQDPGLLPKDILVMAPDIEAYAPLIEAVFGSGGGADSPEGHRSGIPYSLADGSISRGSALIRTFLGIMDLQSSRFRVTQVLSLLDAAPVQKRFGLNEADVERIRHWIGEAGIRWGINGKDRARIGLPAFEENTWRAGLDRLLLGYAMAGRGESLFRGIVPYDDIEGMDARILGRFLDFVETLLSEAPLLDEPRPLGQWSNVFSGLLDKLFDPCDADEESDLRMIRRSLEELRKIGEKAHFRDTVEFTVMKSYLSGALEKRGLPFGYLTGAVTFCAMVPMRSIPFPVVCLIGMNNADYPRHERVVDFDLMTQNPRPGDRSRRDDDRYLFLEALLSARKTLYISYAGQSTEDNSTVPPSVLISELLDYLEQGFACAEGSIQDHLLTVHHLQAFDPSYFAGGNKLFSYSVENCRAARCLINRSGETPRFAAGVLPAPQPGWREIAISDLAVFFRNPAKFLLQRRIGLSLAEGAEIPQEKELFRIESLDRYRLGQELVEHALAGSDPLKLLPVMMASGQLPHGTAGACQFEELCRGVRVFAEVAGSHLRGQGTPPLEIDTDIDGFRLSGRIEKLYETGLVHYRYANLRARDHLRFWIDHLLWQLAEPELSARSAVLIGRDEAWSYADPEEPRQVLHALLLLYGMGLKAPLPFFPDTSLAYAEAVIGGKKTEEEALRKADGIWRGNEQIPGEGDDPYFRLCFGTEAPLTRDFRETALEVFEPLLRHRKRFGR